MNIIDPTLHSAAEKLAVRVSASNPNHHLWCNHGVWWTHFTVHLPDYTKKRVRVSLGTRDVEQARRLRDVFLTGHTDPPRTIPLANARRQPTAETSAWTGAFASNLRPTLKEVITHGRK